MIHDAAINGLDHAFKVRFSAQRIGLKPDQDRWLQL
jgi:hypothetical protein